jgi:type IV pilus assembly protein PilB
MAPRKKLGELLLSEGLIDEIQLSSAIGHQRNWGGKLGSTLIELGFISEDEIARALERQLRQNCLSDKDLVPEEEAMKVLSGQECLDKDVMPLRIEGSVLVLAMSNPYDLTVIDELGFKLGKRIRAMLAVESSIKRAVKKYYFGEVEGRTYRPKAPSPGGGEDMEVIHYGQRQELKPEPAATAEPAEEPKEPKQPKKVEPSAEIVSKALAYLLIEKGIIKRDELIEKMKTLHDKSQG